VNASHHYPGLTTKRSLSRPFTRSRYRGGRPNINLHEHHQQQQQDASVSPLGAMTGAPLNVTIALDVAQALSEPANPRRPVPWTTTTALSGLRVDPVCRCFSVTGGTPAAPHTHPTTHICPLLHVCDTYCARDFYKNARTRVCATRF